MTSREAGAHHAGCGGDVAAAIRKVQQQCYLPPGIRNQDLENFLATRGQMHLFFPGPQVPATPRAQASQRAAPHNAVAASIPTAIPGFPGAVGSRVDAGASSSCAVGFAHVPSGLRAAAQPVGATPVTEESERAQACAYSSCLSNSHNSSIAHRASSTFQNAQSTPIQPQSASPGTVTFLCLIASCCHV